MNAQSRRAGRKKHGPIVVPVPINKPRTPIHPGVRHRDRKNDFQRQPKHRKENSMS